MTKRRAAAGSHQVASLASSFVIRAWPAGAGGWGWSRFGLLPQEQEAAESAWLGDKAARWSWGSDAKPSQPQPHRRLRDARAFTLIELLVVVSIIALLIGILLPVLGRARRAAQMTTCSSNARQLAIASLTYATDNQQYFVRAQEDNYWPGANLKRWHGERLTALPFPIIPPLPGNPEDYVFDLNKSPLASYMSNDGKVKACPVFEAYIKDAGLNAFESGAGGFGYNAAYLGGQAWDVDAADPDYYQKIVENSNRADSVADPAQTVMFTDAAIATKLNAGDAPYIVEYSFAEPYLIGGPWPGNSSPSIHFRHDDRANAMWGDGHGDSQAMTFTGISWAPGGMITDAQNRALKLGWFGPQDNTLFDRQ